jgi:hypothetical protein
VGSTQLSIAAAVVLVVTGAYKRNPGFLSVHGLIYLST